jgi:hypothetical protein
MSEWGNTERFVYHACSQHIEPFHANTKHESAAGVGEVSKVTFTNPPMDKTFGVPRLSDPEGARDLTMLWQEHAPNPHDVPGEHCTCFQDHVHLELATRPCRVQLTNVRGL